MRDSNPSQMLGRHRCYHYTNGANGTIEDSESIAAKQILAICWVVYPRWVSEIVSLVGHSGLEPETLRLSGVRSKPAELMPVKMVGSKGLEPLCLAALDPKSSVSANSTNSPKWCEVTGSNRRPSALLNNALTVSSIPPQRYSR